MIHLCIICVFDDAFRSHQWQKWLKRELCQRWNEKLNPNDEQQQHQQHTHTHKHRKKKTNKNSFSHLTHNSSLHFSLKYFLTQDWYDIGIIKYCTYLLHIRFVSPFVQRSALYALRLWHRWNIIICRKCFCRQNSMSMNVIHLNLSLENFMPNASLLISSWKSWFDWISTRSHQFYVDFTGFPSYVICGKRMYATEFLNNLSLNIIYTFVV